jgi:hypothetical protein
MSYRYKPETGEIVFSDGVKYTIDEAVLISKGSLSDGEIRIIHYCKKLFDGEIEDCFGFVGAERRLQEHKSEMRENASVPAVRPVLQEFYGRGKPRSKPFNDPNQGVLNL